MCSRCAGSWRRRQRGRLEVTTLYIEPGSPRENGYIESFSAKLRDELLDREIFYTLPEAKVLIDHREQGRTPSASTERPVVIPFMLG